MKKFILSLFVSFGMVTSLMAQSASVAAEVEALRGGTAKVSLNLNCPADTYSGMNFSIQFPETGFSVDANALKDWTGASAVGEMKSGKVKFSIASANKFSASTIVTIYFMVDKSIDLGVYDATVTDMKFDNEGTLVAADDVPFKVKVVDELTLDEESTTAPEAISGVNIKVKRTMKANTWSTICLPFAMTEAQAKAAFGDGVKFGDFKDYEVEEDGKDIAAINVKFTSVTTIEANHPYIIKPSKPVSEFSLENVNVAPASDEELEINLGTSRKPKSIIGNYKAGTKIQNGGLFLKDGKFYYSVGDTKIKGFRAYFNFYDLLTEFEDKYATSRINITFDDVTAIKTAKTANGEEIYTLSGQRVQNAGKGVYIVNGKKVIKK